VRIRKTSPNGPVQIEDLGNADRLLGNQRYFTHAAKKLLNQGIMPAEDGWGGWLGRYQAALVKSLLRYLNAQKGLIRKHERNRQQERSFGR